MSFSTRKRPDFGLFYLFKNYSPTSSIEHTQSRTDVRAVSFVVAHCPYNNLTDNVGGNYSGAFKTISKTLGTCKIDPSSMVLQGLPYNSLILRTPFLLEPISSSPFKVFYPEIHGPEPIGLWTKWSLVYLYLCTSPECFLN